MKTRHVIAFCGLILGGASVSSAAAEKPAVYVADFSTRSRETNELTAKLTEEFEIALGGTGNYLLLERRSFDRLRAHAKNEAAIADINGLTDEFVQQLKLRNAQLVVFGEVFDDIDSGQVSVTVSFVTFTGEKKILRNTRIARGKINDAETRSSAMQELAERTVPPSSGSDRSAAGTSEVAKPGTGRPPQPTSPRGDWAVLKDLGDLRMTVTECRLVRVRAMRGEEFALQCIIEFANKNTTNALVFAANGETNDLRSVRSFLTDSRGNVWRLSQLQGVSVVAVYGTGSPSAIADSIVNGRRPEETRGYYYDGDKIWTGDLTTLAAAETAEVVLTFTLDPRDTRNNPTGIESVQLASELVVGTQATRLRNVRLYNVVMKEISVLQ